MDDDDDNQAMESTHLAGSCPEETEGALDNWEADDLEGDDFDILKWDGLEVLDELEDFNQTEDISEKSLSEDETGSCMSSEEDKESVSRYSRFKSHRREGHDHHHDGNEKPSETEYSGNGRDRKRESRGKGSRETKSEKSRKDDRSPSVGKDSVHGEEESCDMFPSLSNQEKDTKEDLEWRNFLSPPIRETANIKKVRSN